LRERRGDIGALAAHFLALATRKQGKPELRLTNRDVELLERHPWPGNVRELASVMERAAILSRGGRLSIEAVLPRPRANAFASAPRSVATAMVPGPIESERERKQRDRANIEAALAASGGKIYGPGGAAELLGMRPTTLASRIQKYGIGRRR
jgi:transcriptional regulator with GAF, ATPase, and Fis domain